MSGAITPTHHHRPSAAAPPVRACRLCGCTENRACLGGCYWVEQDLCSACRPKVGKVSPLTRADQVREVIAAGGALKRRGGLVLLYDAVGNAVPAWQQACATVLQEQSK